MAAIPFIIIILKKLRQTLTNYQQQSRQLEDLSKLTGQIAHEIKNPLSTVKINLQLLRENIQIGNISDERLLRKIDILQSETDRVAKTLEGYLQYIRKAELNICKYDINCLISDMVDFFTDDAASRDIQIHFGRYSEPLYCDIDVDMIKQVVLNILLNAKQAFKDGGEIIIAISPAKNTVYIRISDTGCGIAPDKLENIFDVYYTSKINGSGFGLPNAKKIIEAHRGSISVSSELGRGTSFLISLPRKY